MSPIPLGIVAGSGGGIEVLGGTVTASNGYIYHTFTSSDTLEVIGGDLPVEALIVAGGAGTRGAWGNGNDIGSGGGGAGGYRTYSGTLSPSSYTILVGGGGPRVSNSLGGQSSAFGIVSTGGAPGAGDMAADWGEVGKAAVSGGASGGGGTNQGAASTGIPGQGNDGSTVGGNGRGGGGGGAGGDGTVSGGNGIGGPGLQWLNGLYFSGGGGGGYGGAGGIGGGASAPGFSSGNAQNGRNGSANTGGGASGAVSNNGGFALGGIGGSGVVIVRYAA